MNMTAQISTGQISTGQISTGQISTGQISTDIAVFLMDLRGGGAERVMLSLAEGLSDCGFKVDVVLVQAIGEYVDTIPKHLRIVNLGCDRLIQGLPAFKAYLQKHRPRAILSALEDTNIVAILAKHWAGVSSQLIVTVHNQLSQEVKHAQNFKRRFVPYLLRWIYPGADAVVGVSQGVVEDLWQLGLSRSRTHAIYNPIITPKFLAQLGGTTTHPWFAPHQPPVILGVGRLNQQKDFLTLIKAFAQLRQRRSARLIILGEGAERPALETLITDLGITEDVCLPGFVANPYAYMTQAAMLVLSSAWEGFGNVLVEAMAVGTPVVSTNCSSGPAEILQDGKYGSLVAVGNADAMAIAIEQTLQQALPPPDLKQRAQDFSLERSLAAYQKLLALNL
jgi:glycosyltransferase involved in cell wall biosynthesis